jgi:glycosyltransferase involved in cell wall biosynthesis
MKLGISGRTFTFAEPGGAAQMGVKQARELSGHVGDLTVFGHDNIRDHLEGVTVESTGYVVDSLAFGLVWEQVLLPSIGARRDLDVLYCPNTYCPATATSFGKVITVHGLPSFRGYSSGPYARFRRAVLPRVVRAADEVVVVSEYLREELIDRFDVDPGDVRVVYNAVDPVYLDGSGGRPIPGLPEKYILYVGAMSENKNVEGVVRAFQILKERWDLGHKLVLIGSMSNFTISSVDMEEFGENIFLPGYVHDERKLKYAYENADVFVFPSFYESFGLPPLEAMACGTPVVVSNGTALPEISGEAAHQVDPDNIEQIAEVIQRIVSDDQYARELADAGKERAAEFTWKSTIDRLEAILREVGTRAV